MKLTSPNLQNDVVRLELLEEAHRDIIRDSSATTAMWNWMPVIATGTNFDAYVNFCMAQMKLGNIVPFVLMRQEDDAFAGLAAFTDISNTHRRLRIGFLWHPPVMRGTTIGTATMLALLERARKSRFRRVEYQFAEDNERAMHVALRLGAVKEGTLRNNFRAANGSWVNSVVLSLLDEEIDTAIKLLKDRLKELQSA